MDDLLSYGNENWIVDISMSSRKYMSYCESKSYIIKNVKRKARRSKCLEREIGWNLKVGMNFVDWKYKGVVP